MTSATEKIVIPIIKYSAVEIGVSFCETAVQIERRKGSRNERTMSERRGGTQEPKDGFPFILTVIRSSGHEPAALFGSSFSECDPLNKNWTLSSELDPLITDQVIRIGPLIKIGPAQITIWTPHKIPPAIKYNPYTTFPRW